MGYLSGGYASGHYIFRSTSLPPPYGAAAAQKGTSNLAPGTPELDLLWGTLDLYIACVVRQSFHQEFRYDEIVGLLPHPNNLAFACHFRLSVLQILRWTIELAIFVVVGGRGENLEQTLVPRPSHTSPCIPARRGAGIIVHVVLSHEIRCRQNPLPAAGSESSRTQRTVRGRIDLPRQRGGYGIE
ncbi:hypothetical protein P152DRAFT_70693 [Eremomyces bilateralis CBS 781.70]|uniref:Uncharacterized protein n=1 Tax=Eremomyces bilateralis CBS 781.70 TaxID=1392243 RepID=A0A6G1FZX4_9PEZI|nr:uncharacterized protein P152DRAFT_70693 [Eremomyces bilateralis CBS 781.70]KAF1811354.1 hypothetical protein P152DRAFT_70693 [Eremomyces bilateralis CBS 781.70]